MAKVVEEFPSETVLRQLNAHEWADGRRWQIDMMTIPMYQTEFLDKMCALAKSKNRNLRWENDGQYLYLQATEA